jgi:ferric-dicitrate binding protein FerR (iron transport regulator)
MSESDLLARRLAGLASVTEAEVLRQQLAADPAQVADCALELEVHALLGAVLRGAPAATVAQQVVAALPAERLARRVAGNLRQRRRQRVARRWWSALAAVLMVGLGLGLGWHLMTPMTARLHSASGEATVNGRRGQAGDAIRSGAQLTAPLVLELPDGSRLDLRAGTARFTHQDSGAADLRLVEGEAAAEVAPRRPDAPLSISTPLARSSALGTRFSVSHHGAQTRLLVGEGRVRLQRLNDGRECDVAAGQGAELQARGEPTLASLSAWAGPRLWLRADRGVSSRAGLITAWRDQGPLGLNLVNDLGRHQPTVLQDAGDGLPAVSITRYDHMLWIPEGSPFAASQALSLIAWVKPTEDHIERLGTIMGCSDGHGEHGWSFGLRAGHLALEVRDDAHAMNLRVEGPAVAIGSWQVLGLRLVDGRVTFIAGGSLLPGQGPAMPLPGAVSPDLGLTVGVGSMDQGTVFGGELRELRVYDRALSDEDLRLFAAQGALSARP